MELPILNFCAFWSTSLHVMTTLLLLTNLFQPATAVNALGNETDQFALIKFKEAISADQYGLLNSWNDSFHFCKWRGVTCGTRHQRVTALNLPDSDLDGTLSPHIGNLSFLRIINLGANSFYGKIPQQVGHLYRLQHVNLSNSMLEGAIPVNLTFCFELKIIDFGANHLHGKIPTQLGTLHKLLYLNLDSNNLTGGIPSSLGNLSSLQLLDLQFNNLAGNIPEELGRLKSLYVFAITSNKLSGTFPSSIFNISSIKSLSFASNELEGSIPPAIGLNMPQLLQIGVNNNKFSGHIPASLSNASQLQLIDLGSNYFVGKVPNTLGTLTDLEWLNLSDNILGSNSSNDLGFITPLTNCSNLKIFAVSYNYFGGVLPDSIANLSSQLIRFYIGVNQVSGTIPAAFENLENLIVLSLAGNLFTGVIPSFFDKFQKLQALHLSDNRLSGRIPPSIGNLTQLSQLYLYANKLEGNIPASIGNLQSLQHLDMSENRLSGEIPPQVIGLTSLSLVLNLSQNSLTGSLPEEVGKLKNIRTLDVSGNNLTGGIPEVIGGCQSLEFLYLQENHFQGMIPSSLASLKGLQCLDLSGNNLSSQIPKDLQKLPFLRYLNLSFNNLGGEVPKEGVFRNKSAISLDGNPKLCGGVSKLQLPSCPIIVPRQRKLHRMHGLKLKLAISSVAGCSLLLAVMLALYWRRETQKKKPLSELSSINFLSMVSYQALHQATRGFSPSNQIGSGGFGSVYKGILDQEGNNIVAVKVLNLQQKGADKSFVAECNALRNIRHRNLVKIITCCSSTDNNGNDFKALVFEYMSNGSLEEWLHRDNESRSTLTLLQRLNVAIDVASALCYLHDNCEPQIIHRDLKPSNVLLDDDMVSRLGDFGLARLIPLTSDSSGNQSSTAGIKGTVGYAAPEYAAGVEPSKHGDVYSYGILVLQLFTGRRPTDEMFVDGCNIHTFVQMAIPAGRLMQIVDTTLIATLEETTPATAQNEVNHINDDYTNEIEAGEGNIDGENSSKMNTYVWRCILPTLKIGLACSEESPRSRMSMEEVLRELHHIKSAYINGIDIRRQRPRRS